MSGVSASLGSFQVTRFGYALSTVIYCRISDVLPIRRLLSVGLMIMGLSSVFGIFATNFQALLIARIAQSAGAGVMPGLGLVLASRYIPYERRGRAISIISAGTSMAFGLGPIVGGLISEYIDWKWLFAVSCLVLVLLPILLRLLPKEEPKPFRFDITGLPDRRPCGDSSDRRNAPLSRLADSRIVIDCCPCLARQTHERIVYQPGTLGKANVPETASCRFLPYGSEYR
ncbi:MFS transporter [Bacillus sp. AFS031507]|uniref:MFS transporter n=1 Tax=Bacillus sp. AFS031507 TaxID=2033496 RepID=UPI00211EA577|nr:MFS transporter [Bacillus sp. AFS031507]